MDYSYFKLLHLLAVMLFFGNIVTGLFWMRFAVKTKDVKIINHTIKGIIKSDAYFTIPGVILITLGGFLSAIYGHYPILHTGWILWSLILFTISGFAFSIKVAPLQKQISKFLNNKGLLTTEEWVVFRKLYLSWDIWGLIAIITPLGAFIMMVLKIPR
jgi:uncharacterized membrane protein